MFYRPLAKEAQKPLHTIADHQINQGKKDRCQDRHDQDHDGGQQNFAAGGPDNLAGFRANLLDELKRICEGHAPVFLGYINVQARDIRREPVNFKGKGIWRRF